MSAATDCANWAMNVLKRTKNAIAAELLGVPLIARSVIVGAASASLIGGIVGLVVGLYVYAPTAWFAVFELGVPAGVAGGIVGLVGALILTAGRRIKRHITPSR
jgi:ABC-type uncharacterized transport system permease subunit